MTAQETRQVVGGVTRRTEPRARPGRRRQTPVRREANPLWAVPLRLLIALAVAAAVAVFLWSTRPDRLVQPDDIVGYPSFFRYNFDPVFLAHRIVVWLLPALTALVYWALTRVGPLRTARRTPRAAAARAVLAPDVAEPSALGRTVRLLPAAAVLWIALSAGTGQVTQTLSLGGLVAAVAYLGLVLVIGSGWARSARRPEALSTVNAVATPVATALGLWLFAHETGTVDAEQRFRSWSWLPWWVAALGAAVLVTLVVHGLRRSSDPAAVERRTVGVVAGGALVFLLAARMPGGVARIQGFDDMHAVVGADLFTRGYFPWRDVLFMHGVFEDALRANVGFAMFEHSVWGAAAAASMLWTPLIFVGYYLLAVWAAPRQWVLHLAIVSATVWASIQVPLSMRWCAIGFVLILLGEVLRRGRVLPTVLFTALLFTAAVSVPEMSFLVMAVSVVFVVHDLTRPEHRSRVWWRRLLRTRDFVLSGLVLTLAWAVFLAAHGALTDWVDYYLYFGPGHAASGALPLDLIDNGAWAPTFFIAEAVTVLALVWSLVRLLSGRALDHRYGVLLAAAITTGLYAEKGLARFDIGHIGQVLTVAVCLWVLMAAIAADWVAERTRVLLLRRAARPEPIERRPYLPARLASAGLHHSVAVVVLALVAIVGPTAMHLPRIDQMLDATPGRNRVLVPSQTGNPELVGYTEPDGTDMAMVEDLSLLLDTLAPPGETVYDFTNNPGYFTYLMQQELSTRMYTVGLALPEISQDELLTELQKANPAVVVFDDLFYGLPVWDGPRNEVRHYIVSPYLLKGWTPVVSTYGFLVMVRDDLLPDLPELPRLRDPMLTDNLYFSMPTCDWGYIPDYLHAQPTGDETTLQVGGYVKTRRITGAGWAYDSAADRPVEEVLVAVGRRVVASVKPELSRPDVADALALPGASGSGFSISTVADHGGAVSMYAVLADGQAHRIGRRDPDGGIPQLEMPDGTELTVAPGRAAGTVEQLDSASRWTAPVEVPDGVDLADYGLATFVADAPLGKTAVKLFDAGSGGLSRDIAFRSDRPTGDSVSVRVGACLQWHGYSGRDLYLSQQGDSQISEIKLSQVAEK